MSALDRKGEASRALAVPERPGELDVLDAIVGVDRLDPVLCEGLEIDGLGGVSELAGAVAERPDGGEVVA